MNLKPHLLDRAVVAFFKDWVKHAKSKQLRAWPSKDMSGVYRYNAREYAVLRSDAKTVMAVYRIRPSNGGLRRLFIYPPVLDGPEPEPGNTLYKRLD